MIMLTTICYCDDVAVMMRDVQQQSKIHDRYFVVFCFPPSERNKQVCFRFHSSVESTSQFPLGCF